MSNIRNLNQQTPFWPFISSFDPNAANHPFSNAYNPESFNNNIPNHERPFGSRHRRAGHRGGWPHNRYSNSSGPDMSGLPFPLNMDMTKLADFISQFIPLSPNGSNPSTNKDANDNNAFTPATDIFDKSDAYVIHFSLPGAKKEDVGVNWDADRSELNVAGVVYRPGVDEEAMKTLALGERQVGVFERKVKLPGVGEKGEKVEVDAEGIGAKMEDGVLVVTIPKVRVEEEFVEVRKVDIE
ncbi:hypothetical protein ACLMJK_004608 [Lecanora helva]